MADAWGGSWGVAWGISWGTGTGPTTDTHDGGSYEDYDSLRRRIREAEKARELSAKKRREAEQRLADDLEAAYRRLIIAEPAVAQEIAAVVVEPFIVTETLPEIDWRALGNVLQNAKAILDILEQRRAAEWMARDEEDIEILLLAQ